MFQAIRAWFIELAQRIEAISAERAFKSMVSRVRYDLRDKIRVNSITLSNQSDVERLFQNKSSPTCVMCGATLVLQPDAEYLVVNGLMGQYGLCLDRRACRARVRKVAKVRQAEQAKADREALEARTEIARRVREARKRAVRS